MTTCLAPAGWHQGSTRKTGTLSALVYTANLTWKSTGAVTAISTSPGNGTRKRCSMFMCPRGESLRGCLSWRIGRKFRKNAPFGDSVTPCVASPGKCLRRAPARTARKDLTPGPEADRSEKGQDRKNPGRHFQVEMKQLSVIRRSTCGPADSLRTPSDFLARRLDKGS